MALVRIQINYSFVFTVSTCRLQVDLPVLIILSSCVDDKTKSTMMQLFLFLFVIVLYNTVPSSCSEIANNWNSNPFPGLEGGRFFTRRNNKASAASNYSRSFGVWNNIARRGADIYPQTESSSLSSLSQQQRSINQVDTVSTDASGGSSQPNMWPPWPFNLLDQSRNGSMNSEGQQPVAESGYRSTVQIFWDYARQRGRGGVRQLRQVGSDLWFNLPPAAPPLVLLAAIPRRLPATALETAEAVVRPLASPPLFRNAFARSLALGYLGVAILSWTHCELNLKRRLIPLPLNDQYLEIDRAILPPFLPEAMPDEEPERELLVKKDGRIKEEVTPPDLEDAENALTKALPSLPPSLRRHLQTIYEVAPKPKTLRSTFSEWGQMRDTRKRKEENIRRSGVMDELVALQSLKKEAERKKKRNSSNRYRSPARDPKDVLGYALVTGASRGIGRAIAVELARYDIPSILVARDIDSLATLANEIETCYGVKCCVLQADLSLPEAATKIHQATRDAGLKVDVLVNNAGVCETGLSVDMPTVEVHRMIQVNAMSVALLNHLYGRDMKDKGRGRILMVSSVVGCVPAGPNVAIYAATKAFEKSLALSMGKELERFGVGVTCLMPGAVRNTSFRSKSGSDEALCWNLPFYTRTAPTVAREGVRAMLKGQTEVCPGWQNRAFVKLVTPMLPERLTTIIVERSWSPLKISPALMPWQQIREGGIDTSKANMEEEEVFVSKNAAGFDTFQKAPPRFLLTLPPDEVAGTKVEDDASEGVVSNEDHSEDGTTLQTDAVDAEKSESVIESDSTSHNDRPEPTGKENTTRSSKAPVQSSAQPVQSTNEDDDVIRSVGNYLDNIDDDANPV